MSAKPQARVAAIQWISRPFSSSEELRASLEAPLAEAVRAGAELVAFSPGVAEALAQELGGAQLGREMRGPFEDLGRSFARRHRITLALGPALVRSAEGPLRLSYLFGPEGELLGTQAQTHRTPAEREAGLVRGLALSPIMTPVGPVGLVGGVDVEYPEVSRILCLQGATILVHQAALQRFDEAIALSRLWREVQANQVFGVEAYAVGMGLRGRSAIHAPVEITPDRTGWLARAPGDEQPAVIVADLDDAALAKQVAAFPICRLRNEAQYRHYFPRLYDAAEERAGDACI